MTVEVREPVGGDWEVVNSNYKWTKLDSDDDRVFDSGGEGRRGDARLPRAREMVNHARNDSINASRATGWSRSASSLANSGFDGKFGCQFSEQLTRVFGLMFAFVGQRQPGLGERLQVVAVFGGALQLLHPFFAVAVNPAEPQERALVARQAADDVVCGAQRHIRVFGGRIDRQQFRGFGVRLLRESQCPPSVFSRSARRSRLPCRRSW